MLVIYHSNYNWLTLIADTTDRKTAGFAVTDHVADTAVEIKAQASGINLLGTAPIVAVRTPGVK